MHRTARPPVEEVTGALADPENPVGRAFRGKDPEEATIRCIATVLHGSSLSNDALIALVDGDELFEGSAEDEQALRDVSAAIADCFTG